jgi:hypothetical protein
MARFRPQPSLLLPLAAGLLVLLTCAHPPVVDEEIYLWLAARFADDPLHPYAWTRAMQPWSDSPETFLFAHPPLHWAWVAGWRGLVGAERLWLLRACAALPPALLLGWATARLALRTTRRPGLAAVAWLASPVTALAVASGLMIDLSAVALATAGLAAWREALAAPRGRLRWLLLAGLLLGLGLATKYSMMPLALAVLIHAVRLRRLPWSWPLWAALLLAWGSVELWIGLAHGGFHPYEVLAHAGEVARGPLSGRTLGVLVRGGLGMAPLLLLSSGRLRITVAAVVSAAALAWALPPELELSQLGLLAGAGLLGASALAISLPGRGDDPHQDTWLLGSAVLLVFGGVILGHNYAAPRYLLPAMAPLACSLARGLDRDRLALRLAPAWLGIWALLSGAMLLADHRYARALDDLALRLVEHYEPDLFTGEWAFRYRLEAAGWRYASPAELDDGIPRHTFIASPDHAAPGPLPWDLIEGIGNFQSEDRFPLRINDSRAGVGWHAETMGVLPLGWSREPLDGVKVYQGL